MSSFARNFGRERAGTEKIENDMEEISDDFEEVFYSLYHDFVELRRKTNKKTEENKRQEDLFQGLIAEATKATGKLQTTIKKCMEFYRNEGGEDHFQLDEKFIKQMKLTQDQLCDEYVKDDLDDKIEWLIDQGAHNEPKFKKPIEDLVEVLNDTKSDFHSVAKKYLSAAPAIIEVGSIVTEISTQKQSRVLKREGMKIRVQSNGAKETHWLEVKDVELVDRGDCPPGMIGLPYRNDKFVLDTNNPGQVVRERFGPLKDEKRGKTKLKTGKNKQLTDINRVTLEFEDPKILELAYRCIAAMPEFKICRVDNKLETERLEPPCIHLNIAIASQDETEDGTPPPHDWICECQMYLRSILKIKTTSHTFYDVSRAKTHGQIKDLKEKKANAGEATKEGGEKEAEERERKLNEREEQMAEKERKHQEELEAAKRMAEEEKRKSRGLEIERANQEAASRAQEEEVKRVNRSMANMTVKDSGVRRPGDGIWPAIAPSTNRECQKCRKKGPGVFCHHHGG
ncbi:hypothetical protein TrLO_g9976 [Triparma laevis f. longispina]|uniref:Uncharacterized protein n=1 Tax=Triparma laevis f. longispina TaxID=1714387 RepID=A0A9W7ARC3_9STRA|nr:hypothetical protein TrLO_g9976 [Triparma laevis f. longispina]